MYVPANPKRLLELVKEKEYLITQSLPHLNQLFEEKKQPNQVYFFMGVQGIMQAYDMMLEQKQPIYAIGGSGITRQFLKHRHGVWNERRLALGITGKVLYYEFTRNDKKAKAWHDPTMKIRFIPDKYRSKGMIDICGNLVINLHPLPDTLLAIVIENETIAETYRQFFEFMWDHAKE
ncbi:MAG: hypothetical protein QW594_04620 [Candidatus Woesearchaeota archaeon]